ncbi:MAG: 50S ribosomal protein L4 [Pedobacter sp.]|nr:MAG: 50S ribosomal protein L4 [Pedobacter sp.]
MEKIRLTETNAEKKKAIGFVHKVYLSNLKTARRYAASTKTKSEVRGGGRKPWRQKGTGQARAGSIRSPLWRGGGVIFGPKPHIVEKKVNKKERKSAIFAALSLKKKITREVNHSIFLNNVGPKTKSFVAFLKDFNLLPSQHILVIIPEVFLHLKQATENLERVQVVSVKALMVAQILKATVILISNEASPMIFETYGKSRKTNKQIII